MAEIFKLTEEMERELAEWLEGKPPIIRELAAKFPANKLYRMGRHRVHVYSYAEDGTMTVFVTGQFNAVAFDRTVFGIKPEDLTECDLPGPDEMLGTALTDDEDIEKLGDIIRAEMRKQN